MFYRGILKSISREELEYPSMCIRMLCSQIVHFELVYKASPPGEERVQLEQELLKARIDLRECIGCVALARKLYLSEQWSSFKVPPMEISSEDNDQIRQHLQESVRRFLQGEPDKLG